MRKMPLVLAITSAALLSASGAASLDRPAKVQNVVESRSNDPSRYTYTRLYCTPDTETHFQDVTVELTKIEFAPPAPPIYIGGKLPASSAFFGGFDPRWGAHDLARLNHPAPAAQFVTFLAGVWSITTTDGETRRFRQGDVLRVEDTSPCKGHITVNTSDKPGFIIFAR